MSESIVVALISSGIMGVVSVVSTIMTSKKSTDVLIERVNNLKKEVEKHNGFNDRISQNTQEIVVLKAQQKMTDARLKKLGD